MSGKKRGGKRDNSGRPAILKGNQKRLHIVLDDETNRELESNLAYLYGGKWESKRSEYIRNLIMQDYQQKRLGNETSAAGGSADSIEKIIMSGELYQHFETVSIHELNNVLDKWDHNPKNQIDVYASRLCMNKDMLGDFDSIVGYIQDKYKLTISTPDLIRRFLKAHHDRGIKIIYPADQSLLD